MRQRRRISTAWRTDRGAGLATGVRSRCKPTLALTTRGMGGDEMQRISQWILRALKHTDDAGVVETTRREVAELAEQFPVPAARLQAGAEAVA